MWQSVVYGMYIKNLMLKAISAGSRTMLENMITAMAQNQLAPVIANTIPFADAVRHITQFATVITSERL